jgi:hypothetical protein
MAAVDCRAAAHGVSVFCDKPGGIGRHGAIIGFMRWDAVRLGW